MTLKAKPLCDQGGSFGAKRRLCQRQSLAKSILLKTVYVSTGLSTIRRNLRTTLRGEAYRFQ